MKETRIKISSVVENQLPQFVKEEFPLVSEFLSQYYTSLETQGGTSDILQNIDQYIKLDNITNLIDSTELTSDISSFDSTINVKSTVGFPDSYGLLLIDSEIITYISKTTTTFEGCIRGFSGVTSYEIKDELTFTESQADEHIATVDGISTQVTNLSILFLKEFLKKVKKQITPGFDDRELYSDLNENLFIKQSIDFYSSKGTDNSFKILFGALYGENVEVIKPRDYLIQPSDAQYRITSDLVVESIEGNPENLVNRTLFQDKTDNISAAQGTITNVEELKRGSKVYYTLSLDSDYDKDIQPVGTVYGKFEIHPKTQSTTNISAESTTLEVDSTVAFPNTNGNLIVELENGISLNITYKSKTLNQFLGCSGITQNIPIGTEIKTDYFAYGYYNDEKIKVRILGVLSELEVPDNTRFYSSGDTIKIKTLGVDLKDYKSNNWFFNIPVKYSVSSVRLLDSLDKSYKIDLYDTHYFKIGNSVTLISSSGIELTGDVISYNNEKSFSVQFGSEVSLLDENLTYIVKKNLSKVNSENYPTVNQYTSNVQNLYHDANDDGSLYVSSPSLPTYLRRPLKINDRSVVFSGTFDGTILDIGKHGFYTGDSIVYKPSLDNSLGISTGIYFIKKISDTQVKLAKSRSNIFTEKFVSVNGSVISARFEFTDFTYGNLDTQLLESQKLIRKISTPQNDGKVYETDPGLTGIFVNGVEVLNYKSKDNIYYGPIENIAVSASGSGYDVINPPILSISDSIGIGASGYCSVIGELERIDVIDPGFDYIEDPVISITGGNGSGASARANLIIFNHSVPFNSNSVADLVKLSPDNRIGFSTYHKFKDAEEVIYVTDAQTSVGGLSTFSSYFVSIQDAYNVKLHKTFSDAVAGINTIELTSYGVGNHSFKSKTAKRKISSITVENKGSNYQNRLVTTGPIGINTALDTVMISNHGYKSGEIIVYNATETPIGGLSSSTSYYITKINDDEFKLSQLGIGTIGITTSFYFDTNQYIDLTSVGSGVHKFNYPEIKVSVKGKIGVSTLTGQDFSAIIQPVFRGRINSIFVNSKGEKYGSEDIINYNRQPIFELNSGSGAELYPIILNGQIVDVLVNNYGSGYNSVPNLEISGKGTGALLTPIVSNGFLISVKVISGGSGYEQASTSITVNSAGSNAKFEAQIKSWKINLVERLIQNSQITDDDGILSSGLNTTYGLQYTHAYSPRSLRSSVQGTKFKDGKLTYVQDLRTLDGVEQTSDAHSPIIGWAYDGNPIYGPYGYTSKTGGSVKQLTSGYEIRKKESRPNESLYPLGFFVEDYTYTGKGDLDEYNGRFGVTPEYPDGIYAYFATINSGDPEGTEGLASFYRYKRPVFPYLIGPSYKSKPINFNFQTSSNQDFIDINQTNWKRNITPYNISSYEYLFNSNKLKQQYSTVKAVSVGSVDFIGIETGGQNYKTNDSVFLNIESNSTAKVKVSSIKGKLVNNINVNASTFDNVEFYPNSSEFIGFTSIPHNYLNNDLITFTGKYDYEKSGNITVRTNELVLTAGVGSAQYTGVVTYFNIFGNLSYPNIRENDIYQIGDEQVKILNIYPQSSQIRVLRNQNETTGLTSYSSGTILTEKPRKFKLGFGISTSYNFDFNREIYFNPKESVGLGTTSGVGIVSTIYFSTPGIGITQIKIPTQSIYIQNHNLNTGDSLIYSSNGGTQISVSTNGSSIFQLTDNSIVYVAKLSNNLIGISTVKVGLGSTGTFVSTGSSIFQNGILYFSSVGTGSTHSFKTNYLNTLSGQITKNVVTVSTAGTHGLSPNDEVTINVNSGITTTFVIKYDDYNRRLVVNPRNFSSTDINTENDTIVINNHNYYTGQKVIYSSETPAGGLDNKKIYYAVVIDSNRIKLSNTYYSANKQIPEVIDITTSQPGTISAINPPLSLTKNQTVVFDLSDSSLSFINNSIKYSAFEFKLYKDSQFKEEFDKTQSSQIFEVSKNGKIGIDEAANVKLVINDDAPKNLYYKLVPINLDINYQSKKDIIVDDEISGHNQIQINESLYNGKYVITEVSPESFKYNVLKTPEYPSYNQNVQYYVNNSATAKGPINEVVKVKTEKNYSYLPSISSITSESGSDVVFKLDSNSIGNIKSTEIENIGFDYSADYSVRPTAKLPSLLTLNALSTFDYIGITSIGKNYVSAPSLVVIDGLTNKVIKDVDLFYKIGDTKVTINKNSTKINNVTPRIIPTNNSNGIKIKNITFDNISKDVIVTLDASFSDIKNYPFEVGNKILIEGVSIGINTNGKGYNSSNYNYELFTISAIDPNIGGSDGTITYNISSYLKDGEFPGSFNKFYSSGRIVPENYFPIFGPVLKKNIFYRGETIYSASSTGTVEFWDPDNRYLKISTIDDFIIGETIVGKTSNSTGIIENIIGFDADYKIDAYSKVKKGWSRETGFLNNDFQRIHDNDYYQYFSYALKSKKDLDTWDNPVSSLNHTVGFKKFANLIIESTPTNAGILTDQNQGLFSSSADLSRVVSLNCVYDFDLARENNLIIDQKIGSSEILFNSRDIQDYIESIGNRVLVIDDISNQFDNNPRATEFSVVESFALDDSRSKKYIALVQDKKNQNEKQLTLITLVHDNSVGFTNQYGLTSLDGRDLGFFDFNLTQTVGNLIFYPVNAKFNNYHVQLFSFALNDVVSGVGTINLGDSVLINTETSTIPEGTGISTNIAGISSAYRSSKVLVQIGATDSSYYQLDEITVIHDGTNVHLLDYGQITTDVFTAQSSSGIGTYNAYLSGSEVKIDLTPNQTTDIDYIVNTFNVSLGDATVSGIGTQIISGSSINSSSVSILGSGSPTPTVISSYSNLDYNCSYCIISIEDKTNLEYQVSELLIITNSEENECYITEFGNLETESVLGITTAGISGSDTKIYFTPNQNIDVDVKVLQVNTGLNIESEKINLTNGSINYTYGSYTGTDNDIRKDFNLTHQNIPIFERNFEGNNPSVVNINNNTIRIPNNFYVTGEEIIYSPPGIESTQAIGIEETSIPGIGVTDKLPSTLYIVKVDDLDVKVAASSSDALKSIPNTLNITSVGIGNSHTFISKNQNKKAIISIDNNIQSPIVSTSTTTSVTQNVAVFDNQIYVSGIGSIYGGDLVKINEEIMKVASVSIGSSNYITVIRPWLGTEVATHSSSSLVTKVYGNYNIVNNQIYFDEPPYGQVPIVTESTKPDEIDYVGIKTGSSFSGRIFLRSGVTNLDKEPYSNNYIFDSISDSFNGIEKTFTLKSNGLDVSGISSDNSVVLINDIFQGPNASFVLGDYNLNESLGITSITFTGSELSTNYDVNTSSVPRGGIVLSVGSTQGFGYQPLVAAGGTAIISDEGTIQSISIGNSGSGYRSGSQSIVNVAAATSSTQTPNIEFIGTASVSNGNIVSVTITNPGFGYTSSNPPIIIFDDPLSYTNIPLVYSSHSSSGVGTGAVIDIVVGQGSSIISFELKNLGYGYRPNEILTVSVGGTIGIPTNTSLNFSEFQISISDVYSDKFSAWTIGSLQVIDPLDSLFDGNRKVFPIFIDGNQTTIKAKKGSNIDIQAALLVFINDILQVPGQGYIFKGGSTITFTEAPKEGDRSKIVFYGGTEGIDTKNVDILETIKIGDTITLKDDNIILTEDDRLVTSIVSSDVLETNLYFGPGITLNEDLSRSLTWCRQMDDLIINGQEVGKDRVIYEPYIQPTTNIIQSIGSGSTVTFYVENVKTFFDSHREYIHNGFIEKPQNKVLIVSQDTLVSATATVNVSEEGEISSIDIVNGGAGYSSSPSIVIQNPVGYGLTIGIGSTAIASTTSIGGTVANISITSSGFGYDPSNPPVVIIESPTITTEEIDNVSYEGDFGVVVGYGTTTISSESFIIFEFYIPKQSYLRDETIVGAAITVSQINEGDFFVIKNSNIGNETTKFLTYKNDTSPIGFSTQFVDGVYQVFSVETIRAFGDEYVKRIFARSDDPKSFSDNLGCINIFSTSFDSTSQTFDTTSISFNSTSQFCGIYGYFSWGKISSISRTSPQTFNFYGDDGSISGIDKSANVSRVNRLKYKDYVV